jgi:hypothetical protein
MSKPPKQAARLTENPHLRARSAPSAQVGDLVAKVVESAGLGKTTQKSVLSKAWRDAVGRDIAAQTEIQGLRGGVLTVQVGSAALAHELMVYYRRDLLARLREQTKIPLTDLRCKVTGAVEGNPSKEAPGDRRGPRAR